MITVPTIALKLLIRGSSLFSRCSNVKLANHCPLIGLIEQAEVGHPTTLLDAPLIATKVRIMLYSLSC